MKVICPSCEVERTVERVTVNETISVRDEDFKIKSSFLKCKKCGEEFNDPASDQDPLDLAYREYRERHGFLQPEAITALREKLGVTQAELAALTGLGVATLSRYENGALQSDAYEQMLQLFSVPSNFRRILDAKHAQVLSPDRYKKIIANLSDSPFISVEKAVEDELLLYQPLNSELNGNSDFKFSKLKACILFFARRESGGVWKTKLNKLLFYADFFHFKKYKHSITGCRYAAANFGPVPDNFSLLYSVMIARNALKIEETNIGEKLQAVEAFESTLLKESELNCLSLIHKSFAHFSATQITEHSHTEKAYNETSIGEIISYRFAESLRLPE